MDDLKVDCDKANIMLACRETGSDNLLLAAHAPRDDVFFDIGDASNTPHNANGTGWYFSESWSWGYAPEGETINRADCDYPATEGRMCLHTDFGQLTGGYNCGASELNSSTSYEKVVLHADSAIMP